MNKGWRKGRVGELIDSLESGISVNGEDGTPADDDYAVLKVSAVTYGKFNPKASKKIFGREYERAKCIPKKDQIIISRSNTPGLVGASCYVEEDYPNRFLPDKLWQTTPHPSIEVDHKWLAYFLASPWARFRLSKLATGTSSSMKNITKGELLTLPISIPPLLEQKKIASFIGCWDTAIEKTEALIAAKEKQFGWLTSKLINGKIEEPNIVCLSEVSEMSSGGTPLSSIEKYYGGDISWVSIADMTKQGKYITHTKKNITEQGLKNSSAKIFPKGTVLYAMYASIGECSIATLDVTSSQAILGIQPSNKLDNQYLYYYLSALRKKIKLQGQQGTQSNLNAKMVKNFKINLPTLEQQKSISNYLTIAHNEIDLLKELLSKYRLQKHGLMQKLLTGEWQIKEKRQASKEIIQEATA